MDKQDAALDASFWINGYRGGLLDFLPEYFNDGLQYLPDTFGGDEAAYRVLTEMRRREGLGPGEASTPPPPTPHRPATAIDENQNSTP